MRELLSRSFNAGTDAWVALALPLVLGIAAYIFDTNLLSVLVIVTAVACGGYGLWNHWSLDWDVLFVIAVAAAVLAAVHVNIIWLIAGVVLAVFLWQLFSTTVFTQKQKEDLSEQCASLRKLEEKAS